ncbi:MAG TPA: NUDIX hydrolase [Polyangiaceae bacterium]|nr:NUDIX hydrolase [Polyangiaceae bacterium]
MPRTHDFHFFKVRWIPKYGWVMDRATAVVIVPIAPDGRVWLEHIERVPTASRSWELPGGLIDPGESVTIAGLRELEEECGLVSGGKVSILEPVLELAPGMGKFPHRVVVARDVVPKNRRPVPQRDEGILAVRRFDRPEVRKMLRGGQIHVHSTIAALTVSEWMDASKA